MNNMTQNNKQQKFNPVITFAGFPLQAFQIAVEHEVPSTKMLHMSLELWLVNSVASSFFVICFAGPAVYFRLDPLGYIFEDIFAYFNFGDTVSPDIAQITFTVLLIFRLIYCFVFLYCTSRFYSFFYIYLFLQLRAYHFALSIHAKLRVPRHLFAELNKLTILHSCTFEFCSVFISMLILNSQLGILMSWALFNGWRYLPKMIVAFLPLFSIIVGGMTFCILTIIGNVHKMSLTLIKRGAFRIPLRFKGAVIGYDLVKRERLAHRPIAFRCASLFIIDKMSGLIYLFELFENVTSAIIVFPVQGVK